MKIYENENEIKALVEAFETGTISDADWRHAEHLVVALYYLTNHDFDTALSKMRDGIFNLLRAFKVDLTKEMPYHETLTVFWMRTVEDFRNSKPDCSTTEICHKLTANFDKDYPFRFYTRGLLFSDEARKAFVAPDLNGDEK